MSVDLSQVQRSVLADAVKKAERLQQHGERREAAQAWDRAAEQARFFAESSQNAALRSQRLGLAERYRDLAAKLRSSGVAQPGNSAAPNVLEEASQACEFRESARRLVFQSNIKLTDVAGLEVTKQSLRAAFALALAKAPEGITLPRAKSLLFYGPPGCGKTLLAAAVSNTFGATFFNAKVGDLLSRYFGDSPKLAQALFEEARTHSRSVIFLDEFDALAQSRTGTDSSADRRLLVSLLTELDGLREKGADDGVLTIAATNRPWDLDDAVLSRFERKIYVPLPDRETRRKLLELCLTKNGYDLAIDTEILLEMTEGYSGREIEQIAKQAIEAMLQQANPDLMQQIDHSLESLQSYTLQTAPITIDHLQTTLEKVRKCVSPALTARYEQWSSATE